MFTKLKNIICVIIMLFFITSLTSFCGPTNDVVPDTTALVTGKDNTSGSISFGSGAGAVGMKSASSSTYAYFQGPNGAIYQYNIILMDWPTNGFFYGTVTNNTNLILTSVQGYTGNQNVIIAGAPNTTNQFNITNGVIMNITPQ